jgi:hypothetical protein
LELALLILVQAVKCSNGSCKQVAQPAEFDRAYGDGPVRGGSVAPYRLRVMLVEDQVLLREGLAGPFAGASVADNLNPVGRV